MPVMPENSPISESILLPSPQCDENRRVGRNLKEDDKLAILKHAWARVTAQTELTDEWRFIAVCLALLERHNDITLPTVQNALRQGELLIENCQFAPDQLRTRLGSRELFLDLASKLEKIENPRFFLRGSEQIGSVQTLLRQVSSQAFSNSKFIAKLVGRENDSFFGMGYGKPSIAINVGVLLSGNVAYADAIKQGLVVGLERRRCKVKLEAKPGPKEAADSEEGAENWKVAVTELMDKGNFDYIVPIGTQAAKAYLMHETRVHQQRVRVVFLGVTYPVGLGLVDSLFSRHDSREICGVAYGADGVRSIAAFIHYQLLPGQKLKFIYCPQFEQDAQAAEQLANTRLFKKGVLTIKKVPDFSALAAEFTDDGQTPFSWYTVEAALEEPEARFPGAKSAIRGSKCIATTRSNCKGHDGHTFAAVGGDDEEIGRLGAELIYGRECGEIPHLGLQDVEIPPIKYWINDGIVQRKSIKLSDNLYRNAEEVFEPSEQANRARKGMKAIPFRGLRGRNTQRK